MVQHFEPELRIISAITHLALILEEKGAYWKKKKADGMEKPIKQCSGIPPRVAFHRPLFRTIILKLQFAIQTVNKILCF